MSGYPDLPKIGDIVTWADTYAGHGHFDGKVVSIESNGAYVSMLPSQDYGGGWGGASVHYALVPFVRITKVRTPKRDREDGSVEANKSFERFIFGRMSERFKKKTP